MSSKPGTHSCGRYLRISGLPGYSEKEFLHFAKRYINHVCFGRSIRLIWHNCRVTKCNDGDRWDFIGEYSAKHERQEDLIFG